MLMDAGYNYGILPEIARNSNFAYVLAAQVCITIVSAPVWLRYWYIKNGNFIINPNKI